MSTSTREEYEPRWVERRPPFAPVRLRGIDRQIGALALEVKTQREVFEVTSDAPVRVESALFYFPGWTAAVDGAEVAIAPQPVTGLIAFDVPAGKHRVVLELRQTPLRRWSSAVSAAALSLCLGVLIAAGRRGRGAARSG
jgi:hypothetical protein